MESFVQESENKRDYQLEIDIELISAGDLSKLDLRVELQLRVRFWIFVVWENFTDAR